MFTVDSSGNGFFAAALQVNGNLNVGGTLTKGGGSFKIDDPIDPANKYLSHSFVESPDMMNTYNGIARLDAHGEAWVELPGYFDALNRDFRYQLTSVGAPQPRLYIAREIKGNCFRIAGGKAHAKVSWQVTGIRQDAWGQRAPHPQRGGQACGRAWHLPASQTLRRQCGQEHGRHVATLIGAGRPPPENRRTEQGMGRPRSPRMFPMCPCS